MMDNGFKEKNKERECINGQMEIITTVNGKKIQPKEQELRVLIVCFTMDNSI